MHELSVKYDLWQPQATVFEGLFFLCLKNKDGVWSGSLEELGVHVRCKRKQTTTAVKYLVKQELVIQNGKQYQIHERVLEDVRQEKWFVRYTQKNVREEQKNVREAQNIKEERTKEEKYIKERSVSLNDTYNYTTFLEFWDKYSPSDDFKSYKHNCYREWKKMPEDWRALAMELAAEHAPDRNPLYWLQDEDFLKNGTGGKGAIAETKSEPKNWNGCVLEEGVDYVTAWYNGKWGTYSKADAEAFGLEMSV